jgi:hypothetical protein
MTFERSTNLQFALSAALIQYELFVCYSELLYTLRFKVITQARSNVFSNQLQPSNLPKVSAYIFAIFVIKHIFMKIAHSIFVVLCESILVCKFTVLCNSRRVCFVLVTVIKCYILIIDTLYNTT